jgi:hypothetical protein
MNEHPTDLDQADEEILNYDEVSDEALEAAAGIERGFAPRTIHGEGVLTWPRVLGCC